MQSTTEANTFHPRIQHVHNNSLKQIHLQRLNTQEILILKRSCPTTSYVAAKFHPTIGQCAHQSLSNTATHELGMIPTRNKGTTVGTHIATIHIKIQPIQNYIWVYQDTKEVERLNF